MSYGQPHDSELPVVGVTLGVLAAGMVTEAISELQATLSTPVTPGGIDINADLAFRSGGTYYGATELHRAAFQAAAALSAATYPYALYVNSTNGDLYYNDGSGNQVRMTALGGVAGAAGNITTSGAPAYATSGVELLWDAAVLGYKMKSGSGASDFGDVYCDDVLLSDGSANYLTLTAAAGMGSDYAIEFPAAVASANGTLLQMATTGVITYSNTGLASVGLAANNHFTVSGTGRFKHGSLVKIIPAHLGVATSGTFSTLTYGFQATGAGDILSIPIEMDVGERITDVTFYGFDSSAATSFTGEFLVIDSLTAGTAVEPGADASSGNAFTGFINPSVAGLTTTVASGSHYRARWTSGSAGDRIVCIQVTYDRP